MTGRLWNSDATNPVGAEYMIMQKVSGIVPFGVWKELPFEVRARAVSEVAQYLVELFYLRFDRAGSIYHEDSTAGSFSIGRLVSWPFFDVVDGQIEYISPAQRVALHNMRGPFSDTAGYLSPELDAKELALSLTTTDDNDDGDWLEFNI